MRLAGLAREGAYHGGLTADCVEQAHLLGGVFRATIQNAADRREKPEMNSTERADQRGAARGSVQRIKIFQIDDSTTW